MIQLTADKVAITPIFDSDKSPGGLWIPDVAKDRCDQGIVKYLGPKCKELKVGQYVLFGGYDGTTVKLEGEGTLILMRETFVKCVVENVGQEVSGLYMKSKPTGDLFNAIRDVLWLFQSEEEVNKETNEIIELINTYSPYFPATLESTIELIASQQEPLKYKNKYNERESPLAEKEDED